MPQWDPQIPQILSDLSVPHKGEGKLSIYFKNIYKLQVTSWKELCSKLFHSSTTQSGLLDTFESCSASITKE